MMVVGSTMNDVMKVTPPPPGALKEEKTVTGRVGCGERCIWSKFIWVMEYLESQGIFRISFSRLARGT